MLNVRFIAFDSFFFYFIDGKWLKLLRTDMQTKSIYVSNKIDVHGTRRQTASERHRKIDIVKANSLWLVQCACDAAVTPLAMSVSSSAEWINRKFLSLSHTLAVVVVDSIKLIETDVMLKVKAIIFVLQGKRMTFLWFYYYYYFIISHRFGDGDARRQQHRRRWRHQHRYSIFRIVRVFLPFFNLCARNLRSLTLLFVILLYSFHIILCFFFFSVASRHRSAVPFSFV